MYKLAQLKEAEVRGTLAALVDNGIVPVDSQEQFEKVAAETIDLISGYDYDINDVAEASSYALEKVASEDEAQYALGELTLSKIAGEIDDDTFDYYAEAIVKEAAAKSPFLKAHNKGVAAKYTPKETLLDKVKGFGRSAYGKAKDFVVDGAKAESIRKGWAKGADGKRALGTLAKGLGKTGLVYGAPLGALGYGAYRLAKD